VTKCYLLGVLALLVAGCGGGGGKKPLTLYTSNGWTITLDGSKAMLYHYVGRKWVVDRSHAVKIAILGPDPNKVAPNPPQVAIGMHSKQPLVESALWVDDLHLFEKGGGSPTNGTIYGAPANPLDPGTHLAVGYARTAYGGTVVAWRFRVNKS
jgi:hypothetical protein